MDRLEIEQQLNVWLDKQISFIEKFEVVEKRIERIENSIGSIKVELEITAYDQTQIILTECIIRLREEREKLFAQQKTIIHARDKAKIKVEELKGKLDL
jgi:hypothetical protein